MSISCCGDDEVLSIQWDLRERIYRSGEYAEFYIFEPKKRLISAAPYRDRVIHHALCNVIEPIFDKTFIYDSYACRKGRGTHRAIARFQEFCQKNQYVLKCDISKYFPGIDHEILYELISRKIKDEGMLWLVRLIIDSIEIAYPSHHNAIRIVTGGVGMVKYYDPVVEEVRARGRQLMKRYGNDPKKIMDTLRERAKVHKDRQVSQKIPSSPIVPPSPACQGP